MRFDINKHLKKLTTTGSAMMFVSIVIFFLVLIVGAVGTLSTNNLQNVAKQHWMKKARFAAYAGVEHGLACLVQNPSYNTQLSDLPLDGKTWVPAGTDYIFSVASCATGKAREWPTPPTSGPIAAPPPPAPLLQLTVAAVVTPAWPAVRLQCQRKAA